MGSGSDCRSCFRQNLLTFLQVLGVVAGIGLGFILKAVKEVWTPRDISYVKYCGELFVAMLTGLILPLIVASMIAAAGSLDLSLSKLIGTRAIIFYLMTTLFSTIVGIALVMTVRPGSRFHVKKPQEIAEIDHSLVQDTLMDLVRTLFPPNLVQATMERYRTILVLPEGEFADTKLPLEKYVMVAHFDDGTNIVGLVVFAITLGIALSSLGPSGKPFLRVCESLADATTLLLTWVIWISPLGVLFLLAAEVLQTPDFTSAVKTVGLYVSCSLCGHMIHMFIVLPALYTIITKKQPFTFYANIMPATTLAFVTASSVATHPVTLKCLEEGNNIDPRITRFLLPIGSTVNMDGVAMYQAVAVIFMAQLTGMELPLSKVFAISFTATAASIGTAAIPQGGLITMVLVLNTVGISVDYITYILPLDWLLDRVMTCVDVASDCVCCGVIGKLCKNELEKMELQDEGEFLHVESSTTLRGAASHNRVSPDPVQEGTSNEEIK